MPGISTAEITLFNVHFRKYVCGDREAAPAECNRDRAQGWEKITLEVFRKSTDGRGYKVSLRSYKGKFLSAQPNGAVEWNRDWRLEWETWTMYLIDLNGTVAFKSHHGSWLGGDHGRLVLKPACQAWEHFTVDTFLTAGAGAVGCMSILRSLGDLAPLYV